MHHASKISSKFVAYSKEHVASTAYKVLVIIENGSPIYKIINQSPIHRQAQISNEIANQNSTHMAT